MTAARIRVVHGEFVEIDAPLSEYPEERQIRLPLFDPPVEAEHGKTHDDDVVVRQGTHQHRIEPGEVKVFRLEPV